MLEPSTPICQSCAMPLAHSEDRGTDAAGRPVDDYCRFCFVRGAFLDPAATAETMTERCVHILVDRGMPERDARALMTRTIPALDRWRGLDGKRRHSS